MWSEDESVKVKSFGRWACWFYVFYTERIDVGSVTKANSTSTTVNQVPVSLFADRGLESKNVVQTVFLRFQTVFFYDALEAILALQIKSLIAKNVWVPLFSR